MDLCSTFGYVLKREYAAYEFYLQNAARVRNPTVAALMRQLALEKESHIKYTKALQRAIQQHTAVPKSLAKPQASVRARTRAEAMDANNVESMIPDIAILRMALLIERDLTDYLERIGPSMEKPVQDAIDTLAMRTREHETLSSELHSIAYRQYVGAAWEYN